MGIPTARSFLLRMEALAGKELWIECLTCNTPVFPGEAGGDPSRFTLAELDKAVRAHFEAEHR